MYLQQHIANQGMYFNHIDMYLQQYIVNQGTYFNHADKYLQEKIFMARIFQFFLKTNSVTFFLETSIFFLKYLSDVTKLKI